MSRDSSRDSNEMQSGEKIVVDNDTDDTGNKDTSKNQGAGDQNATKDSGRARSDQGTENDTDGAPDQGG